MTLFRDPSVRWGGEAAGGIRLAAVDSTMLASPTTYRVRDGRSSYVKYEIGTIAPSQGSPPADLAALLADVGLSGADFDRWLISEGKPPIADADAERRAGLAAWLAGDPRRIERIRTTILKEETQ